MLSIKTFKKNEVKDDIFTYSKKENMAENKTVEENDSEQPSIEQLSLF